MPAGYVLYAQTTPVDSLVEQGFDPKTLLVLNLGSRNLEDSAEHQERFFLSGDGCGNYLFVNANTDPEKVLLWAHDPVGIEDPRLQLSTYLPSAVQEDRIDHPPRPNTLHICRTPRYGESILDPIALEDWIAAVNETSGIEYRGYRDAPNPFTGQVQRIELPGIAVVVVGSETFEVSYWRGGAALRDTPLNMEIAATLAAKLGAHVLRAESV